MRLQKCTMPEAIISRRPEARQGQAMRFPSTHDLQFGNASAAGRVPVHHAHLCRVGGLTRVTHLGQCQEDLSPGVVAEHAEGA